MNIPKFMIWMTTAIVLSIGTAVRAQPALASSSGAIDVDTHLVPWKDGSYSIVSAYANANGVVNQTVTLREGLNYVVTPGPAWPITIPAKHFWEGSVVGAGLDGTVNTVRAFEKWLHVETASTGPKPGWSAVTPTAKGLGRTQPISYSEVHLLATAEATGFNSKARGYANDPLLFDPGTVTLTITISEIELISGENGDGAMFAGGMTSLIPNLETLYDFAVYVEDTVDPLSAVSVAFASHPDLGLDDAAIAQALQAGMVLAGGSATQTNPVSFDLTVSSDEAFELSVWDISYAASTDVPEPMTLLLAGVGMLLLRKRTPAGDRDRP